MPISRPVQIFPNDLRPSRGIGIDIPFNKPGVFTPNYQTKDAIKNNLINFFLTNPGERLMNPTFGGGLRSFLFEQISQGNIDFLEEEFQNQLNIYFGNIVVEDLSLTSNPEEHTINVSLKYSVANTNINDNINIEFNS
jgi:phage baseplate assembly protein W